MSQGDFNSAFTSWFNLKVDRMTCKALRAVEEAAEKGENITKHHIETRGTAKSGKRGRIDTGAMLDSVSSEVMSRSPTGIQVRFGYEDTPYWTKFQEPGFEHVGGVTVEGTHALQDAADEVLTDLLEDIEGIVRDA